ncbi:Putative uncharacterized protein [Moritella viscosa]|nr:Putative uncharacterized protein [Moritella viscosa]
MKPQPKKDAPTNSEPQKSTSSKDPVKKENSITYSGNSTHNGSNNF